VTDRSAAAGGIGHATFLYRTRQELAAAFAELIVTGTAAGEAVHVASTAEGLADLREQIDGRGLRATLVDLSRLGGNPGRVLSMMRMFAHEHRGTPVRFLQQITWPGRPAEQLAEAVRNERLTRRAVAAASATVLCAYDARQEPGLAAATERAHPRVLGNGRWRFSTLYDEPGFAEARADPPLSMPPASAVAFTFRDEQAEVRQFTMTHAQRAGLPRDRVIDLVLAIGELAANTLRHTSQPGTLMLWHTDHEVIGQVSDTGQIDDPLAGTFRPGPTATTSRRGLWLVNQVADLVQIRTGSSGTVVRVHMCLPCWSPHTCGAELK
jgi:anti-sigma regulatory factor (Ser/Thr protein kinase)